MLKQDTTGSWVHMASSFLVRPDTGFSVAKTAKDQPLSEHQTFYHGIPPWPPQIKVWTFSKLRYNFP